MSHVLSVDFEIHMHCTCLISKDLMMYVFHIGIYYYLNFQCSKFKVPIFNSGVGRGNSVFKVFDLTSIMSQFHQHGDNMLLVSDKLTNVSATKFIVVKIMTFLFIANILPFQLSLCDSVFL